MPDSTMPDWKSLVRQRMKNLKLDTPEKEEVVVELSSHVEEAYENLCKEGLCKSEALRRSLEAINWQRLCSKIRSAKRKEVFVNNRTRQFWVPALVTLAISEGVLLVASIVVGSHSRLLMSGPKMVYLPWLVSLPLAAAAGACLSRRAGGQRKTLLAASLFPAAVGLCFICTGIAITLVTGVHIFANPQWLYASRALGVGVVVPSAALLLGSLPFLRTQHTKAEL
jgi:lysylphosphatidylglycerol synthetase-like protein (DUF2156 family)